MATGTVAPTPRQQFFDNTGVPLAGGKLYTYYAGTTTPLPAYTDVALSVAHPNPIILDSAGRATIYLSAASYKFVLHDADDVQVWTQDTVSSVAPYNVDLDIDGVAGETLPAGSAVYLASGTGGTTAGRWYLADASATATSSAAAMVAMVPSDVSSGTTGSVRIQGRMTGLTGLTAGATHYVSETAGGVTATPPTYQRVVGVADSTTSLVLFGAAVGNVITVSGIDFVALESDGGPGDIVATINASTEGLAITADRISISGLTTFASGYNPTSKVAVDLSNAPAAILNSSVTPATLGVPTTSEAMLKAMYLSNGGAGGVTTIDGGLITTGSIAAEDIAAGTVTGWTVQTSSGYPRIALQSASPQLAWYNASGSQIGGIYDDTLAIALAADETDFDDANGIRIGSATNGVKLRGYSAVPGFLGTAQYGELSVVSSDGNDLATLILRRGSAHTLTLSSSGFVFSAHPALFGAGIQVTGDATVIGDILPDSTVNARHLGSASVKWKTAHFDLTANTTPAYTVVNDPSDATALGYCLGHTGNIVVGASTLNFQGGVLVSVS